MAQKAKKISDFLRTLADYLDRRTPEITEFKSIVITSQKGTFKDQPYNFQAKIKGKDISKAIEKDFDLCAIHLNVCDWFPCPEQKQK